MPQHEGHPPLLEAAVLLSENCLLCKGTGRIQPGQPLEGAVCHECDGAGRQVREVPLSELWPMAQQAHARVVAPPPSALREQELRT